MKRHHQRNQNIMIRGSRFGWMMQRPDGTAVHSEPKKDSRISRRLMREILDHANLRVTYHRILDDGMHVVRGERDGHPITVGIPDPDREPGEWSPFDDDGNVDHARLKKEGWTLADPIREP